MAAYAIRHTVPVWVLVGDDGEVDRVIVEDENISAPIGYAGPDAVNAERGWTDEDTVPYQRAPAAVFGEYAEIIANDSWPAWEVGW